MPHLLREIIENRHPVSIIFIDESAYIDILCEDAKKPKPKTKKKDVVTHLDHLEDLIIRDGREGFDTVESTLKNTHDYLRGRKNAGFGISTKIDGSPALVVGRDTKTGKFFVGTKSYFNQTPKINFTDADISANHGSSKGLSKKLRAALKHLEPVVPKTGIFQGDMLFTHDDLQKDEVKNKISFQPNALTYSTPLDSDDGQKIAQAKVGFAPHTEYKDIGDGEMRANFNNPISKFKKHPDVYLMDSKMKGDFNYTSDNQKKFNQHLQDAKTSHKDLSKSGGYLLTKDHSELLLAYINNAVKERRPCDAAGYAAFIQNRYKEKMTSLKMGSSKNKIKDVMDSELNDLMASKNVLNHIFKLHAEIGKAKNVLVDALSKGSNFQHSYQGKPSKAEGFVVTQDGRPLKLVDRQHFSAANFEWNSKVNPSDNPMVISWGRMNPPTAGHEKVIERGQEIAQRTGAKHQVYTTRTTGNEKNPLDPKQKLDHLKTMFPGKNIALADKDSSTIMAQLQHLHNSGVKDLTLVTGSDRSSTFQDILNKYNGPGKDKLFNFKRIRVISAGSRDSKSQGVEGTSGTKMRDAAKKGDYKSFAKDLPTGASDSQAKRLFKDLQHSMKIFSMDEKKKPKVPTLQQTVNAARKEK